MIVRSIRWRLQAWHGLILILVLIGFGVTAHQLARGNQLRRIDRDLERRVNLLLGALRAMRGPMPGGPRPDLPPSRAPHPDNQFRKPPPPEGPREERMPPLGEFRLAPEQARLLEGTDTNTFYFIVWRRDGRVIAQSTSTPGGVTFPGRPQPSEPQLVRMRGTLREIIHFTPPGECILVGRSIATELAEVRRLAWLLLAAAGAVLVFGLAGGWWLATRAIRPIEDISATALKISDGDLSQRIDTADTESELGHLAAVLNSTFARLEANFEQQARFTADAAHELRTPVSVILAQTQAALARERPATEYRESLEACQRAAQRMRRLTESLLELARLEAGQEPFKSERFDLSRAARESVEALRPLASERRVELQCDLPATECVGDPERISQVITNLLSNAIHYNHEGGQVRLSTGIQNGAAILNVADTGAGIPAEELPHIFERFYRVDKSRARPKGRTGLGLAICKAIIDAHRGSIEVSSQPGEGSIFTLKLPAN